MAMMNQQIFKLGLSTEAVSLYLICCSLSDDQMTISTRNLMDRWIATNEGMNASIQELMGRNILQKFMSDGKNSIYKMTDSSDWISD
jgi:hypothetical protein